MLALEEVERDSAGVVGFEELSALLSQMGDAVGGDGLVSRGFGAAAGDLLIEQLSEERRVLGIDADVSPLLLDVRLYEIYRDRLLAAVGSFLVAPEAEKVEVGGAMPVGRLGDAKPAAAALTPDRALQVVMMDALLLAGHVVRGEDLLNPLEDVVCDEPRMRAVILDALPGDRADVVAVPKHAMDARFRQRLLGEVSCRSVREASVGERSCQAAERPVAGGVLLERPLHKRRSLFIDLDGADLPTAVHLAHVQVPDRRLPEGAASFGLLHRALDDLAGQVPAVELRDRTHDPVQERSARGVVNALRARDERCPRFLQGDVDLNVVDSIAREAVNLVDDDVVDPLVGNECE